MKPNFAKTLLQTSLLALFFSSQAHAQNIRIAINEQELTEVEIQEITLANGILSISTDVPIGLPTQLSEVQSLSINGELLSGVVITSALMVSGTLELTTTGDPIGPPPPPTGTPTPPPTATPTPTATPPPTSAGCGGTVTCDFNINWTSSSAVITRTTVPSNRGILASQFTTSSNPDYQFTLNFQPPAGWAFALTNFWISTVPGDTATAVLRCSGAFGIEGMLRIFQKTRSGCVLQTNTTYYLNMQHQSNVGSNTLIDRKQSIFGAPDL